MYANWDNIVLPKQQKELVAATVREILKLQVLMKRLKPLSFELLARGGGDHRIGVYPSGRIIAYTNVRENGEKSDYGDREISSAKQLESVIEDYRLLPQTIAKLAESLKRRAALKVWRPNCSKRRS